MIRYALWFVLGWMASSLLAQYTETDLKVYTFNDGLSHRNIFDLLQDSSGLLWLGTIDGLNSFDGYSFYDRKQQPAFEQLDLIKILRLTADGKGLYAAGPDFVVYGDLRTGEWTPYRLHGNPLGRRQSLVPTAMEVTDNGLFVVLQNENNGQMGLYHFKPHQEEYPRLLYSLPGQYTHRPLAKKGKQLLFGATENELWTLDSETGQLLEKYSFAADQSGRKSRIAAIQAQSDRDWVLMDDGRLFYQLRGSQEAFQRFMPLAPGESTQRMQSLLVTEEGDIFLGGVGRLLLYDSWKKEWEDLDAPIRQLAQNTCTYRSILVDLSGVVWIASDFGAIRITRSDQLFTQYLSGGSEYCSNVYCSTRGITEDAKGRIYISYYNSIHVLDPQTNDVRPLFPANDYFNYPYGLVHHQGYLYTGDGNRIRLSDLQKETIFPDVADSEGVVAVSADDLIWFSYDRQLLIYKPSNGHLEMYRDSSGRSWANLSGAPITYLLPLEGQVFIGTHDAGLYRLDLNTDRVEHWQVDSSRYSLCSNRINALYLHPGRGQSGQEWRQWRNLKPPQPTTTATDFDACQQYNLNFTDPHLFLATASGLQAVNLRSGEMSVINEASGLPNDFINGILPEGDSAIWASTDYGLCRFSLLNGRCINFFSTDGLSADEFNRISFYRAKNGRLYFGGLNGVNAFLPENYLLEQREKRAEVPLLLTNIRYVEGKSDSLRILDMAAIAQLDKLRVQYNDRLFLFSFSLADYRFPSQNRYSYYLEGYDKGWSSESTDHRLRLNDLPPGEYVLHLRARVANEEWLNRQLSLPIHIQQPYYYNWWFWASLSVLLLLGIMSLVRLRVYSIEKKRRDLAILVEQRTAELREEQAKSEALLLNILPAQTARELKEKGQATARRYDQVTVFFSDFVAFTAIANSMDATALVEELDYCFRTFDEIVARYGLEKIKTIGDAYLFVGGLNQDGGAAAVDAIRAAKDIQTFLNSHAKKALGNQQPVFRARIGLHSGPLVTGVVGIHKFAYDIWGETVNIAARMESLGVADGIVISETTYHLIGSHFSCRPYGIYEEHGKRLEMWSVE